MNRVLRAKRMKSIEEVMEEVEDLIDAYHFNQFSRTKTSSFLKKVIENQRTIEVGLFKKTWRTLNCTPKTMKVIREIQKNLLVLGGGKNKSQRRRWTRSAGAASPGLL